MTAPVVFIAGVKPVAPAENDVTTVALPLLAAVKRPCESTVMLASVYEPAVTEVLAN